MKTIVFAVLATLTLSGCQSFGTQTFAISNTQGMGQGSGYMPVVDGPKDSVFYDDLSACRTIAVNVEKEMREEAFNNLLAGALAGAIVGNNFGPNYNNNGAVGAMAGAAASTRASGDFVNGPKHLMIQCMKNRGHNVLDA